MKLPPHQPDINAARRKEFEKREAESFNALWDALETLDQQGIDIGTKAKAELSEREIIRENIKLRTGVTR